MPGETWTSGPSGPHGGARVAATAAALLGHETREQRWERRLRWPVIAAAILAIPGVFLGVSRLPEPWPTLGVVLHRTVWLVFAGEVLVMLAVTQDRARWLRRHKLALFIVVVSSPLLPALALLGRSLQGAASLNLLKLAKLTKLAKAAKTAKVSKIALAKPLVRLGRLWRVLRTLGRRLRLGGAALVLLIVLLSLMVLGSLTVLVEGERYRSPAHGAWHVATAVERQVEGAPPLGFGTLALSGLGFVLVVAWSYARTRQVPADR